MASAPDTVLLTTGASEWQLLLLTTCTFALALFYTLVTVAAYRVSRSLHPFVLFFSESIANVYGLYAFGVSYALQLLQLPPIGGDVYTEFMLCCLCTYSCQLHYVLIAVNRGFAVLLPLNYDSYWSRQHVVASVVVVWVGASAMQTVNLARWVMALPALLFQIYVFLQRVVTLPSLCIYGVTLGWVLVNRLVIAKCMKTEGGASPASALSAASYAKAIDLRIFFLCFLSFLPNCYNLLIHPPINSLHFQFYAIVRLSSPGVLLFAMSTPIREHMPLKAAFRWSVGKLLPAQKKIGKKKLKSAVISLQTSPLQRGGGGGGPTSSSKLNTTNDNRWMPAVV